MSENSNNPETAAASAPPGAGPRVRTVPPGDNRQRLVCPDCNYVQYENPLIVVGAVATWEDKILLCKRAINPRKGYWTIPAGFLELHEAAAHGAIRETMEEAGAEIEIDALLAVYNVPRISQVQLIYRARLLKPEFSAGEESEAVELYEWDRIPWDELAFPSVHWALHHFDEVRDQPVFTARTNALDNAWGEISRP
jgi:ADP-ribose pyrophosphatase YjhB (NUDIX family)